MATALTSRIQAAAHEQQLAAIVESSDDAIISNDLDGIIVSWNSGAQRLFGYTAEEAIGQPVAILIPPDRIEEEPVILARVRQGERVEPYETVRRRKDGSRVHISLTVSPIKTADGQIIGMSKIARDITERREAETQRALLINEFRHRLKNTIATVQAIASQTLRTLPRSDRDTFFARLNALSGAHDLIAEGWNRASVRRVVDRALDAFRDGHIERFAGDGPSCYLDAQQALTLTMVLHELGTNAVKYGALSNGSGRVFLAWDYLDDRKGIKFRWWESGGPPVKPPKHSGFGSQLIYRALEGSNGTASLEFLPEGASCTLEILF